jgi:hypothetical protein
LCFPASTDPSNTTGSIRHYQRNIYPILANRVDEILAAAGVPLRENFEVQEKAVGLPKDNKRSRPIMKRVMRRIKAFAQRLNN